jgi:hypothetical protein
MLDFPFNNIGIKEIIDFRATLEFKLSKKSVDYRWGHGRCRVSDRTYFYESTCYSGSQE